MTGTFLNIATVLVGGILGYFLGSRLPDRLRETVTAGLGLFTLAFGLQMFLGTSNALIVLGSILVGGVLGEALKIEDGLQGIGVWLERRFIGAREEEPGVSDASSKESRFVRGFLTASLVFCVGPMAILGSVQDGLTGDFSVLAVKSMLDGFGAMAFASSLGVGVLFSTLVILVYQGGITLLAAQVDAWVSAPMMVEMNAAGGVILLGIALSSLLNIKKIRVGSFLPALIIAPIIVAVLHWF